MQTLAATFNEYQQSLFNTGSGEIAFAEVLLTSHLGVDTHWLLSKRRQADAMSKPFIGVVHVVIADSGMACHSVVPDAHGVVVPFDADLQISRDGDVLQLEIVVSVLPSWDQTLDRTLNKSWRSASDSSSFNPMMRRVKPGLMYRAFSPVAWKRLAKCRTIESNCNGRAYRMHAHDRMVVLDRLPANELAISPRVLGLSKAIVLSLQAFEQALNRI